MKFLIATLLSILPLAAQVRMTAPAGWVMRPSQGSCGCARTGVYKVYGPRGNDQIRIYTHRRPDEETADHAFLWRDVLDKPTHVLDETERRHMIATTRQVDKDFEIREMRTADLNGKRVLVVEGEWHRNSYREKIIYADSKGDGELIDEIGYGAPAADYATYLEAARKAFASVVW
jgi:hypothetical protein